MKTPQQQLEELEALDSPEIEEAIEEAAQSADEAVDETAVAEPEQADQEPASPPEMETQPLDESEAPALSVSNLDEMPDAPEQSVPEDPVLPQEQDYEVTEPPDAPVVESEAAELQSDVEPSQGGTVESPPEPVLPTSEEAPVPPPPDVEVEVQEINEPPEPPDIEASQINEPGAFNSPDTLAQDFQVPEIKSIDHSDRSDFSEQYANMNDATGMRVSEMVKQQDDLANQLAQNLTPMFDDMRLFFEQTVQDHMQEQIVRTTILGRVP